MLSQMKRLRLGFSLLLSLLAAAGPAQAGGWLSQRRPDAVAIHSGHRNNIFYVNTPVAFILQGGSAVRYEVRDYWGTLVDAGPAAPTITPSVRLPGWYKLYLYGTASIAPWGDAVGGTMFVIFRNDPHFPLVPSASVLGSTRNTGAEDEVLRGVTALGPQRNYVENDSDPAGAIQALLGDIALDKQYYLAYDDPLRPRDLMIAFPNGTANLSGVSQVVSQFQDSVRYWEPRNEPNGGASGTDFAVKEMKPFARAVKAVNPSLKVLGPGTVSVGPGLLPWIEDFLKAGGGDSIDAFSFHAYNNVNGDLWLARTSLDSLNALLAKYGQDKKEKWQTEQGYMAPVYGAYEPRHQGRWTMLQMMVFEQYGITKEHNHLWYDKSHGFWDAPMFTENEDGPNGYGSLNPAAPLMRVWSEELFGTKFAQAYDFGDPGNKLYLGSLFQGPDKAVAAFMSAGGTDGRVVLQVGAGSVLHTVSAFGVESDLPVLKGQVSLPVPEIPVYVELAPGQTIQVVPQDWGPNLARQPGVTARSSGLSSHPLDASDSNDISKLFNGQMENSCWSQQSNDRPWMSNVTAFPAWAELDLPTPALVNRVVIYCPVPWQWDGSLLDYELQYDKNGQWATIEHVQEPAKSFPVFTPPVFCTADSFYSDRCIFTHQFAPVTTGKLRVLVHDCTWGGGATADVVAAGGQTGPHQFSLREIEAYSPLYNPAVVRTISGWVRSPQGLGVPGVTVTLTGTQSATAVTNSSGFYLIPNLTEGGAYTLTPLKNDLTFAARSQTYSHLVGAQVCNFTAAVIPVASGTGLKGQYYDYNYDLSNAFSPRYYQMTRTDAAVDFPDFAHHAPAPGIGPTLFAVRWTGQVEPKYSETYTFTTDADDGVRLWVNGQLLIDHWVVNQARVDTGTVSLTVGRRADIRLEYFQMHGDARCRLSWSSPSQARQVVPQQCLYPAVSDVPPSVSLTGPAGGTRWWPWTPVSLTAAATANGAPVAQVAFYANGVPVGQSAAAPYGARWSPRRFGAYQLTAAATDALGAVTVSDPVTVYIGVAPPTGSGRPVQAHQ